MGRIHLGLRGASRFPTNTYTNGDNRKWLSASLQRLMGRRGVESQYRTAAIIFATVHAVAVTVPLRTDRCFVSGMANGSVRG
jgi:hypothetical protein